jgi:hypothetical protein
MRLYRAPPALTAGMALSKAGFMIVGDSVRVGQRVRFMVSKRPLARASAVSFFVIKLGLVWYA